MWRGWQGDVQDDKRWKLSIICWNVGGWSKNAGGD